MKYSYLLVIFIFTWSCSSKEEPEVRTTIDTTTKVQQAAEISPPAALIVNIDNLRLRESPGEKGKEIIRLAKGTELMDMGELSDFTTRLKLRGIQFDEPWIKVKTSNGQVGWVFGGCVNFSMENPSVAAVKLMEHRLKTTFGAGLSQDILRYRQSYQGANSSETFTDTYQLGARLRDTMVTLLESKIAVEDYERLPDLFWLEQAMPGYVTQLVAEGTQYYLFQDYKKMEKKVRTTAGFEDDDYIEFCMSAHSLDSVEHFFPAWFLQTWDYGGSSLLGQGVHLRLLKKVEALQSKSPFFQTELTEYKNRIVEDITGPLNNFWEPLDKINTELNEILAAQLSILTPEDIIALETRRKMFKDPRANKILVNQKAG